MRYSEKHKWLKKLKSDSLDKIEKKRKLVFDSLPYKELYLNEIKNKEKKEIEYYEIELLLKQLGLKEKVKKEKIQHKKVNKNKLKSQYKRKQKLVRRITSSSAIRNKTYLENVYLNEIDKRDIKNKKLKELVKITKTSQKSDNLDKIIDLPNINSPIENSILNGSNRNSIISQRPSLIDQESLSSQQKDTLKLQDFEKKLINQSGQLSRASTRTTHVSFQIPKNDRKILKIVLFVVILVVIIAVLITVVVILMHKKSEKE